MSGDRPRNSQWLNGGVFGSDFCPRLGVTRGRCALRGQRNPMCEERKCKGQYHCLGFGVLRHRSAFLALKHVSRNQEVAAVTCRRPLDNSSNTHSGKCDVKSHRAPTVIQSACTRRASDFP